jgi:hypothetical protein
LICDRCGGDPERCRLESGECVSDVIRAHGGPMELLPIAAHMGLSKQRIHQTIAEGLAKLKIELERRGLSFSDLVVDDRESEISLTGTARKPALS